MELLKIKEVMTITRLSRPTIYRLIKQGSFPKQIHTSTRSSAWLKLEVHAWIERLSNQR